MEGKLIRNRKNEKNLGEWRRCDFKGWRKGKGEGKEEKEKEEEEKDEEEEEEEKEEEEEGVTRCVIFKDDDIVFV